MTNFDFNFYDAKFFPELRENNLFNIFAVIGSDSEGTAVSFTVIEMSVEEAIEVVKENKKDVTIIDAWCISEEYYK